VEVALSMSNLNRSIWKTVDYLVIGHVTKDHAPGTGFTIGGTAAYAARTAQALGCRVGVMTSAEEGLELSNLLPKATVKRVAAPVTTTFDNQYDGAERKQKIEAVAAPLGPELVPHEWRDAPIVHLGPVAQECDPRLADCFPNSFLGLTPQGWMRRWDQTGRVIPAQWERAEDLLSQANAVVVSEEDVGYDESLISRWARRTPVLVVTRGARGCVVHSGGHEWQLPAPPTRAVDPTGAGDILATVLFIRLWRGDPPDQAARRASCLAAASVARAGLGATPTPEEVLHCMALCQDRSEVPLSEATAG